MIDANTEIDAGVCVDDAWSGVYSLKWECVGGCESDAPYRYLDTLTITGENAVYSRAKDCNGCEKPDTLTFDGDCFSGSGIPLGNGESSDPYTVCTDSCSATGDVSWTGYPGPMTLSTWRVTLSR